MDPLSQGVVGVTLPQALTDNKKYMKWGFIFAFLGGMAPDLDVLIKSSKDSLLALEYHRQFTHSLIFIPLGGLIVSSFLHFTFRNKMPFRWNYFYTTLGFSTHALLDACTTYGTQLFWPFTNMRVSWCNISIIDPLFTIPLLLLTLISMLRKKPYLSKVALAYGLCYLSLGVIQRERAETIGYQLAQQRNHKVLSLSAKPSIANLLLWKVIYETQDQYHVDAIRVGLSPKTFHGESIDKLNLERDLPWLDPNSQHAKDIERFRWFSQGYIAQSPQDKSLIIDVRYSLLPNSMSGLWGIKLSKENQNQFVKYVQLQKVTQRDREELLRMLFK